MFPNADRGGEGVHISGSWQSGSPEGCLGPDYVAYVFVFLGSIIICRTHKLKHADEAQVSLQLTGSISDSV